MEGSKRRDVPLVKGQMGCGGLDCTVCLQLWVLFCDGVGGGAEGGQEGEPVGKADDEGQGGEVSEREIVDKENE